MNKLLALSGIALSLALAACGGGGGDSGSTATQNSSVPTPTPTPAPTPTPTPTPPPSLANPDAGSTAAVGNGFEGFWTTAASLLAPTSSTKSFAMIASDGTFLSTAPSNFYGGTLSTSGSTWVASSAEHALGNSVSPFTDTGTFSAKSALVDPSDSTFSFDTYAASNALAVTQSDVAGKWGINGNTLTLDASGNFNAITTQFGLCTISGTVKQYDSNTSKNMFKVTLTAAATGSGCRLNQTTTYNGLAVIDILNAGTVASPNYVRTLVLIAGVPGSSYLWLQLPKN